MFADFILQQEIESAMNRIVSDARIAYKVDMSDGRLRFKQHTMTEFDKLKDRDSGFKPWYMLKIGSIYHNGESSPITGGSFASAVVVRKFDYHQIPNHPKLLYIKIEAESLITNHRITLTTVVFMRGLQDE